MPNNNLLYIGVQGKVIALNRASGQEIWRTKLKGGDFVNLVLDGDELYATTKGELFRLDPRSGKILWNNTMPGLGLGMVTIGTATGASQAVGAEKQRRDEAASDGADAAAAGI